MTVYEGLPVLQIRAVVSAPGALSLDTEVASKVFEAS